MADYYQRELVADLRRQLDVSESFAKTICHTVFESLHAALLRDDRVHLTGIGILHTVYYRRHETIVGRGNRFQKEPRPPGRCVVPAYRRLAFRRSDLIRQELRLPHE